MPYLTSVTDHTCIFMLRVDACNAFAMEHVGVDPGGRPSHVVDVVLGHSCSVTVLQCRDGAELLKYGRHDMY